MSVLAITANAAKVWQQTNVPGMDKWTKPNTRYEIPLNQRGPKLFILYSTIYSLH